MLSERFYIIGLVIVILPDILPPIFVCDIHRQECHHRFLRGSSRVLVGNIPPDQRANVKIRGLLDLFEIRLLNQTVKCLFHLHAIKLVVTWKKKVTQLGFSTK